MSSSLEESFESMLSMLVSSGGPTAFSSPPVNSFPSLKSRGSGWSRIPWLCSGSGLESWVVVAHGRLVLEIVESDRKEEGEVVCFSESWWGRNLDPAWASVAVVVLAGLEVPVELVVDWVPVEQSLRGLAWHTVSVSIPVSLLAILSE